MFKSLVPVAKLIASPFNKQFFCLSSAYFSATKPPAQKGNAAPPQVAGSRWPLPPPREPMDKGEVQDMMEFPTSLYLEMMGKNILEIKLKFR